MDDIQRSIEALSREEVEFLTAWLGELEARRFDEAIERGMASGKFDALADEALAEYKAGLTRKL